MTATASAEPQGAVPLDGLPLLAGQVWNAEPGAVVEVYDQEHG